MFPGAVQARADVAQDVWRLRVAGEALHMAADAQSEPWAACAGVVGHQVDQGWLALGGQDQLSVLRESQAVLAAVVDDQQLTARAEQRLARHTGWRFGRLLPRLAGALECRLEDHPRTIIVLVLLVN